MIHFSVRHFSIIITILLFSACSHLPNELKTAEKLLEDKPDSALLILKQISPEKYSSAEAKALYNLLYIRVLDKKHLPLKPDSLLDFSISYYEKHPNGNQLAMAYLLKGRMYYYRQMYEKSVASILKSRDVVKDSTDYLLMGRICADIARISSMQKDYTYQRQKLKQALHYYQKGNNKLQYFYTIIEIGRSYSLCKDYKSAISYFRKLDKLTTDSMTKGDLLDQYGFAYYESKKLDSALYYFRQTIGYPYMSYNRAIRYMNTANAYFDIEKFDSAEYYASNAFNFQPEIRTQRECHRILANCLYLRKDFKGLQKHMNEYVFIGDSLRKIDAQTKGSYIEDMHKTTKEADSTKHVFLFLLFLLPVILILISWFFIRLKRRHKETEAILLHKNEEARNQSKDIVRQELIDVLKQKIDDGKNKHAELRKKASSEERDEMIKQYYTELLHLDNWNKFTREMCPMFGNLPLKLETDYPTLTHKEISWCCLYLLDISQADILTIIEYKPASYSKFKQRLAKKLNLSDATELNDFLHRKASEQ